VVVGSHPGRSVVRLPWGYVRPALAVAVRPWLWRAAWAFKPQKGLFPPREYVEFRMETYFADKNHQPTADELVGFLRWCRRSRQFARHAHDHPLLTALGYQDQLKHRGWLRLRVANLARRVSRRA
jgi:hypothetical protein